MIRVETGADPTVRALLDLEAAYQSLATTPDDLVEGMAAFKERRDARFTGR
ncbi:MAG: hypothetical protein ACRDZ1_17670 [Acidimicrobiia bacterium]